MIWFSARGAGGDCSPAGRSDAKPGCAIGSAGKQRLLDALTVAAGKRVQMRGCPHCDARQGRAGGLPRYRCADCRPTFNALSGTSLARLRHKDRWPDQARALMTGESAAATADRCGIAYTAAFRWRHRFLEATAPEKPTRPIGIVEAEETFILESFKGRSRLKGWLRPFHGVASKNLPHYLGWRRTLEAFGNMNDPSQWLDAALSSATNQQVTIYGATRVDADTCSIRLGSAHRSASRLNRQRRAY